MNFRFLFLCLLVAPSVALTAPPPDEEALPPIIVTATRIETPAEEITKSVTVITREQIETQQLGTVEQALRQVPGMAVVRTGSVGSVTSIFLRGTNSDHALVLIDGVRASTSITGEFDFADLTTDNIERIEIIRGPQSVLYGSDAIGGVIHIITRRGVGRPEHTLLLEGGRHRTFRGQFQSAGAFGYGDYSLAVSRRETQGFMRHDEYQNTTLSGKLGLGSTATRFTVFGRYTDADKELPPVRGRGFNPNQTFSRRFFQVGGAFDQRVLSWLDYNLKMGLTRADTRFSDPPDPLSPFFTFSQTDAQILNFDGQVNVRPVEAGTVTVGGEWTSHTADFRSRSTFGVSQFDRGVRTGAAFGHGQLTLLDGRLTVGAGGRFDDHSRFGQTGTWQLSSAFRIQETGTRFKGSWGTAFKAPDLADLFFPGFANPDLQPEKARGFEVGVEQTVWTDVLWLELVYFDKRLTNLIQFDPVTLRPENIARASMRGLEFPVVLRPLRGLQLRASYSLVETEDHETGQRLLRRPKDTFLAQASYSFLERFTTSVSVLHVRNRKDLDFTAFPARRVTLRPYTKVDLGLSVLLAKQLGFVNRISARAKIENVLNRRYEEAFGFPAPGLLYLLGLQATF